MILIIVLSYCYHHLKIVNQRTHIKKHQNLSVKILNFSKVSFAPLFCFVSLKGFFEKLFIVFFFFFFFYNTTFTTTQHLTYFRIYNTI